MIHYNDYVIELLEQVILRAYNDGKVDYTEHQNLLKLRKELLNRQALAHQQELLPDIIAFTARNFSMISGLTFAGAKRPNQTE